MKDKARLPNPFPGLRSFRSDEDYLFFGRDEQALELVARLQRNRFIAVVGTSGQGKSSLVRCGLLSRLQGGGMVQAGAHWEIAVMHPGGDPFRHLAQALLDAGLYDATAEDAVPQLLATLRRSQFGLTEAVRQAALPAGTNFLLVVDQFEEIFRYEQAGAAESEVANDFVAMLREACAQNHLPLYVVTTMRSDFIGDCAKFEGLAEVVNRGEYLIPRLTRDQFKAAIEGPIRVAGGQIAPRLVQRLLNDVGEEQDQLPCLQHALMRTWRVWQARPGAEALDLEDYAAVGKMSQALSLHADEVMQSLATDRQRELCAAMFKALTVEGSEKRGIRRPRRLQMLCRILDVEPAELQPVIDAFRQPEVSFLMPPIDVELRDSTVIDLSHESLMRVWTRLRTWVEEEAQSVGIFRRLSESAALWRKGRTGLCRDPELSIARAWLRTNRPNAAWAEQYEGNFEEAMAYLQASTEAAQAEIREREQRARAAAARKARRQHWLVAGLATTVVGLLIGAVFGIRAQRSSARQASQTDFMLGSRLLDDGKVGEGIAYLVRAGRRDPANPLVAPRLLSVLTARNFVLPVGEPLKLPVPAIGGGFSADGRWLGVQGEDDKVRIIDTETWRIVRDDSFAAPAKREGVRGATKNSELYAVALVDGTIAVVDSATGRLRVPLITPPGKIFGRSPVFGLSPNGQWLGAAGNDELWIWETKTGKLLLRLPNNDYNRSFDFGPDGRTVVTTFDVKTQVRSLPDGSPIGKPIEGHRLVFATAFSANGRRLLVGDMEGFIVADALTGVPVRPEIQLNPSTIDDVQISPDGSRIIYTTSDRMATVLDVATGQPAYPPLVHGGNVLNLSITADGSLLFTNSVDGLFRIWDLRTGRLLAEPTARQAHFTPAAISSNGRMVAMMALDGSIYRLRPSLGAAQPLALPRTPATTTNVNFAQGAPARIVWITHDEFKVIDVASGKPAPGGFRLPEPISQFSRSNYGGTLGSGDIAVLHAASGSWRAVKFGVAGLTANVPMAEAGSRLGAVTYSTPGGLVLTTALSSRGAGIWDLKSGRLIQTLPRDLPIRSSQTALAFSPDEKRFAFETTDDRKFHVREVGGEKDVFTLQLNGRADLTTLRYTPNGTRILTGDSWGGVQIWDAASGRMQKTWQRHRTNVERFDFSPDGRYVVSLSTDGTIQLWNAASYEPVGEPLEQPGAAARADFSPDGLRLATPSSSGSARVWDVATGLPVTETMSTGEDRVNIIAYSPDGKFVDVHGNATSPLQHVRYWSIPPVATSPTPDWLLTLATICAGETLTDAGKFVDGTPEFAKIESVRSALAAAPAGDEPVAWGRWILSDDPNRPIAPGFTITPAEAKKLREEFLAAPASAGTKAASVP